VNVEELLEHTRSHYLRDMASPHLWEMDELRAYLNEAQSLFARHTHCLTDDVELVTEDGVGRYLLEPETVYVLEVYEGDKLLRALPRAKLRRTIHKGAPRAYTLDAAVRTLRLAPVPDDEYTLNLLVAHMPRDALTDDLDEPVIPAEYHLNLCDWVAYKALRNNDTEGSNTTAAENFRAAWGEALVEAKREMYHLRAGPASRAIHNWTGK
jgi:hypothetical protein